jgi:hypothetical protein
VAELQDEPLSNEQMAEIIDMLECTRPAKFILWEDEEPTQAQETDSGVPCGAELPPRGLVRGWEVCERCINNPILKCALYVGAK